MSAVYVVGLGTNDKLTSRLIRTATQGANDPDVPRWSHTWLEFSHPEMGVLRAIHADDKGVHGENVIDVWQRYPKRRRFEIMFDLEPGLVRAFEEVGKRYDTDGVVLRGLLLTIQRITGHVLWVPQDDLDEWFCSELVCTVLKHSGFPGHGAMVPHLTTPDKVESICEGEPKLCRELDT